jgi:hypothetical protein
MWMLRALLVFSGCCGVLGGDSCNNNGPPPADTCNTPAIGTVDTITVGRDDDVFTAYHDGDLPHIVRGGQGAEMMGIRLKLTGAGVPACLSQMTSYQDNGAQGRSSSPVKTYRESDGSYTTKALWIPGYFPSSFSVLVAAGGRMQSVRLGIPDDM